MGRGGSAVQIIFTSGGIMQGGIRWGGGGEGGDVNNGGGGLERWKNWGRERRRKRV
jgi:hypothetical protein